MWQARWRAALGTKPLTAAGKGRGSAKIADAAARRARINKQLLPGDPDTCMDPGEGLTPQLPLHSSSACLSER